MQQQAPSLATRLSTLTGAQRLGLLGAGVALLLLGATMPGQLKAEIEGQLWHAIPWAGLAHFVLFFFIAAIPAYGRGQAGTFRALLLALVLAVGTEWLQSFVPGRTPTGRDVFIDLAGTACGLAAQRWLATQSDT